MKIKHLWAIILLVMLLGACSSAKPKYTASDWVVVDEALLTSTTDFETGTFDDGSSLSQQAGQYVIHTTNIRSGRYLAGKSQDSPIKNMVIEVKATQQVGTDDNWFGVMCRIDEANVGYAFLISSDGFWALARSDGSRLRFLENWRKHSAIKKNSTNTIQAYCIDDYLALYINGEFIGDIEDNRISEAGQVALISGGPEGQPVTVAFHDLQVKQVYFKNNPEPPTSTSPIIELNPIIPQTPSDD